VICVLSGGVGAARLLSALAKVVTASDLHAVVNVGDDLVMHGLTICPDLDTISYTLAGLNNTELGWGLAGESWRVMKELNELGGEAWFALGDRDLATHLYRSQRLAAGATKSMVTAELTRHWGLDMTILPVSNDPISTEFSTELGRLSFQEYFVRHHHEVAVTDIQFSGAAVARLSDESRHALLTSERIVIAPSNPLISIAPILAVADVRGILTTRRSEVVAVSPIINGAAIKGPADRLLGELGHEVSCVGVARYYRDLVGTMIIDVADAHHESAIRELGMEVIVSPTIMSDPDHARALVAAVLR